MKPFYKKTILYSLILLASTSLYGGDQKYSPMAPNRHAKMTQDLLQKSEAEERHFLTGDWYEIRALLAEKGVTFTGVFVTDTVGNPSGGAARGFSYAGSFGLDMLIKLGANHAFKRFILLRVDGLENGNEPF